MVFKICKMAHVYTYKISGLVHVFLSQVTLYVHVFLPAVMGGQVLHTAHGSIDL